MTEAETSLRQLGSFAIVGWLAFWTSAQCALLLSYGFPFWTSLTDAAITQLGVMADSYIGLMIFRYYRPSGKFILQLLVSSAVLNYLLTSLLQWLLKSLVDDSGYLSMLSFTLPLRFLFMWLIMVLSGGAGWIWFYLKEQSQNKLQQENAEKFLREAELSNLRQQLQPHFLFNSLNSISSLAGTQPELARKMVEQLSVFLRGTIKKDANQFVSLEDEIDHLNLYLEIEKVRFGHRLATHLKIAEDSRQLKLPSLLLQPVVENAIKFGLYDTLGTVTISVSSKVEENNLIIQIVNPFDKESSPPKSGTGFGLSSVQRRLALLFFRNDLLKTEQTENTFITTLKIPQ